MLNSEVRLSHANLTSYISNCFLAYDRPVHSQVCTKSFVQCISMFTDCFLRSLIAALLGNIIGGLFVGLPAVYFYLGDWHAGGMRDAEEARLERKDSGPSDSEKSA